jgi:5-methylcytosine-specific restriction endonuclease McrA
MSPNEKHYNLLNALNNLSHSVKELNKFIANQGQEAYLQFRESEEWKDVKAKLYCQQGGKCARCLHYFKEFDLQMDHILPKSKYVTLADAPENFQLLCKNCNQMKSYKMPNTREINKLPNEIRRKFEL